MNNFRFSSVKNTHFLVNKCVFLSLFLVRKRSIFVLSKGNNAQRPKETPMTEKRAKRPFFMKIATLAFVVVFSAMFSGVQGQGWEFLYGGSKEDQAKALVETNDGGFLLVGYSESFGPNNDLDVYAIRTDVDGQVIWSKVYNEGFIDHAYDVIATEDGGFLIVGDVNTLGTQANVLLLKIDANGNKIWSRQYGTPTSFQQGNGIAKGVDGGYVLIGLTRSTPNGESNVLVIKVDDNGNRIWERTYGGPKFDDGRAITRLNNGYVFVGTSDNERLNAFDRDIIVYHISAQGDSLNYYRDASSENEEANDVIIAQDGGIVVVGKKNDNSDAYILKLSPQLSFRWSQSVDVEGLGEEAFGVVELNDGSLVITGITEVDGGQNLDVLLAKLDKNGNKIWVTNLGEKQRTDYGEDLVMTQDGGFAIAGYTAIGLLAFINDALLIKTDSEGNTITNFISGRVFHDMDGTCTLSPDDEPLKGWLVKVTGNNRTYFGTTDENGRYRILVDTGRYNVALLPVNSYWESCIVGGYNVNLLNFYDTTSLNFPVFKAQACPYLEVDISTPFLAVCSDINYTVAYCNLGTMTATDAYVEVLLDDKLTYVSSSIPFTNRDENKFRFELGDLAISECGSFTIETQMACSGIASGQSALVSARIFPDTVCLTPGPNWDGSSIIVSGKCDQDTVTFTLRNAGRNDMRAPLKYYIVEDIVMLRQQPFQLGSGQEIMESIKSNGATYRIIAEQSSDHPGRSYPTVAIEGCAEEGALISTGYVTQFPEDDQDNFIDIDVQEIIGSMQEQVQLRGYPKGYRDSLITAETEITYTILFRNTGTDIVERVVIRDTLSNNLDPATFIGGASSFPYNYEIYGNGVLKITFDNIALLPDGGVNETSNWGFINFRIAQKPNNPTGTVITNSAAIYFNYDAPVQTNSWRHVVGQFPDYVVTAVKGPIFIPGVKINVRPNPFIESATFEIEGHDFKEVIFSIFDMTGRRISTQKFSGNQFMYYRNHALVSGMYIYKLETSEGQPIGSGKLMVR